MGPGNSEYVDQAVLSMGGFIASFFLGILKLFGIAGWLRERDRRKQLEQTIDRVTEREELERDINRDEDDQLIDRLSGDD